MNAPIEAVAGARRIPFHPHDLHMEARADGSFLLSQDLPLKPVERSIAHLFVKRAREIPDRVFVAEPFGGGWRTTSYAAMLDRAARIAAGLKARGLRPGDRLMVLSGETIDHTALALGASLARVVHVPISVAYSLTQDRSRLDHVLKLIGPALVFAQEEERFRPALEDARATGAQWLVGGGGSDGLTALEATDPMHVDEALAEIGPDTIYKIILTSGSTNMPRAVIQTHAMNCFSLAFEESLFDRGPGPFPPEVVLMWMPMSHVGGSMTNFNTALYAGASTYLDDGRPVAGRFDATIRHLKEFPPQIYATAPAACVLLTKAMEHDHDLRELFFSRISHIKSGAAGMPEEVRRRFQKFSVEQTGEVTPIVMGYGTTEAHGVMSLNWHTERPNMLGFPKPGALIKLAPIGGVYEIRVKGGSVTPGYFNDPEATAAAFDEEGFFRTGDSASFDPHDLTDGPAFAGRIGENFKMATGTWVSAGDLRACVMDALDGIADDCIVVGEGKAALGLILWMKQDPVAREKAMEALRRYNLAASGASRRIGRMVFSEIPISAENFEKTEKGTLNRKLIIGNRSAEIAKLYEESCDSAAEIHIF